MQRTAQGDYEKFGGNGATGGACSSICFKKDIKMCGSIVSEGVLLIKWFRILLPIFLGAYQQGYTKPQ